jgi:hypothetical protein
MSISILVHYKPAWMNPLKTKLLSKCYPEHSHAQDAETAHGEEGYKVVLKVERDFTIDLYGISEAYNTGTVQQTLVITGLWFV